MDGDRILKKPFISLRTKRDVLCLAACVLLVLSALSLFFLPDKSIAVFNSGDFEPNSIFGLICNLV